MIARERIAIALGANLGDRLATLEKAARALAEDVLGDFHASRVYESPPWGIREQPDFLNAVVTGTTDWSPVSVFRYLKSLEKELGRVPGARNGPRAIDLDLLAYGVFVGESDELVVPHPRLHERDFVLLPFADVWPDWRHPRLGRTVREMAADLARTSPPTATAIAPLRPDTASP